MVSKKRRRSRSRYFDSRTLPQIKQELPFLVQLAAERMKGRWPEKVGCGLADSEGSVPEDGPQLQDRRRSNG